MPCTEDSNQLNINMNYIPYTNHVFLPGLTSEVLNPSRCALTLAFCRLAAEKFAGHPVEFRAVYRNNERVGYACWMPDRISVIRLALYYESARRGAPFRLALTYQ